MSELSREERQRNLINALNQAFNDNIPDSVIPGITTRVVRGTAGERSAQIEILLGSRVIARESEELIYATAHRAGGRRNGTGDNAIRRILADMEANMVIEYLRAHPHPEHGIEVHSSIGPISQFRPSERFRFGIGNYQGRESGQAVTLDFIGSHGNSGSTGDISFFGFQRVLERLDNEQRGRLLAAAGATSPALLQDIPRNLRPETGPGSIAHFMASEAERRRLRDFYNDHPGGVVIVEAVGSMNTGRYTLNAANDSGARITVPQRVFWEFQRQRERIRQQERSDVGARQSNLTPTSNLNLTMTPVDTITALSAAPNAPLNPQVLLNKPELDGHG